MLSMDDEFYVWDKGDIETFPEAPQFHTREMSCQCTLPSCKEQKISRELIRRLHSVRASYGYPVLITSGYRCHGHQEELRAKGYETSKNVSQHELGQAADIKSLTPDHMGALQSAASQYFTVLGVSSRFLHVDTRLSRLFWKYKQ